MARRNGRPGAHLITDDNSGFTTYGDKVTTDYWGNITSYPLERNLQEISSPLGDPYPVTMYRGPQYQSVNPCQFEAAPSTVGLTHKVFPRNSAYVQGFLPVPAVGTGIIGCTFKVG